MIKRFREVRLIRAFSYHPVDKTSLFDKIAAFALQDLGGCVQGGVAGDCSKISGEAVAQCPNNDCGPSMIEGRLRPIIYGVGVGWGAWVTVYRTGDFVEFYNLPRYQQQEVLLKLLIDKQIDYHLYAMAREPPDRSLPKTLLLRATKSYLMYYNGWS